ncbi:penicillin-binding protein 2 [Saxibacter everestensis]|uniref:Penicillin-binding protein 2 n=1 Tax=Saxibacter everestensis TaxID=2909229 RepID=A0ABY8QXY3_9MICO|nr:penicillin-binding protein 2 [Brevibacteriaceae bacterium ZFBP1038]
MATQRRDPSTKRPQQSRKGKPAARGPLPAPVHRIKVGQPNKRMRWVITMVMIVFLVFCGRLVQIQGFDPSSLAAAALQKRLKVVKLPAERGEILAADGTTLATTVKRYTLVADQLNVSQYKDDEGKVLGAEVAAEQLAPLLETDADRLLPMLDGKKRWKVIAKGLSAEAWNRIDGLGIPGLTSTETQQRSYPNGAVAGNVTGFVGSDGSALAGLESSMNKELTGTDGSRQYERGVDGSMIPLGENSIKTPVNGKSVELTIDSAIQWYAQQQIAAQVKEAKAESGTVVVLDVKTGEILAAAEAPTVDPNDPGASDADDRGARVFGEIYEPGSTAKVVTAAALLEENLVESSTQFEVPYKWKAPNGEEFRDSHPHGVEKLTFAGIIGESSNTGTLIAGQKLTKKQRHNYLTKFGFGQPTGLNFPGASSGLLAGPDDWDGRTQYTVMFGQGVAATALQSASVFATIGNDGVRLTPKLVKSYIDPDGTRHDAAAQSGERVVSADTARMVTRMLEGVVNEGTGKLAAVPGYRVAGKTGTAQAPAAEGGGYDGYTASFIGMAPADNPQIVVASTLQRPRNGHYGGPVAGPVFQKVMSYALQARGVPPSGSEVKELPQTWK